MRSLAFLAALLLPGVAGSMAAQTPAAARPQARIHKAAVDLDSIHLAGNVHPEVRKAITSSALDPDTLLDHLVLHLQASPSQEAELDALLAQQGDPTSPNYHRFLSPQEFGARFGVADEDIATVSAWLRSRGLEVEEIPQGHRQIVFRGTADQVAFAFQTELRSYTVKGVRHIANASNPRIPAAFADVVGGVVTLHDFYSQPQSIRLDAGRALTQAAPAFALNGVHTLAPGDLHTIYDVNPLLSSGIDGTGQSIAVLARSNIYLSDVQSFRSMFGLKANDPQFIITNADPGQREGDNLETTLDTEWAGALAPGAAIKVVISASTAAADGIDLSAIYAVNNNIAPIITVSYGACEAALGATHNAFYNSLWKQAAAQGQTVLVASGDSGAAGCSAPNGAAAQGMGVNGLCSSPYSTCVGGTQFTEGSNPAQYWFPAAPDTTTGTAKGYIPEAAWNESGSSNAGVSLASTGGGASIFYAKPAWQIGPGVPADAHRDVPDVSLTAAMHDGYTVVQGGMIGYIITVGGTSASTPAFAGMVALLDQQTKSAQGNINPTLYALSLGKAPIFHDINTGNNSVPGQIGFPATAGYDQSTGLGSVDANLLVTMWNTAGTNKAPLTVYATTVTAGQGQSGSGTVTTVANNLNAAVTLSVSGVPAGVTATLVSKTIAAPGSGTTALNFSVGSSVAAGVYELTLTATSGSQTAVSAFSLIVLSPTFTLVYPGGLYPSVNFGPMVPFQPQSFTLQTQPADGFNSSIAFSTTGLPSGITAVFSPASVSGANPASTTVTFTAASTVKGGSYRFNLIASGGGITRSVQYTANVMVQPSCALSPDQQGVSIKAGTSANYVLTCSGGSGANPVTLSNTGLPGGLTAVFSSTSVTSGKSVTLTLSAANTVNPGTYPFNVVGSEPNGASQMVSLFPAVATPVFALSLSPARVVVAPGKTVAVTAVITPDPGFTGPVSVWVGGRPNGVAVSFRQSGLNTILTLTVASNATPGTYPLIVGAGTNTGFGRQITSTLTIGSAPACNFAANPAAVSLTVGKSTSVQVACPVINGSFSAPLSLSVGSLASGLTAKLSSATLKPGSSVSLTLTAAANSVLGSTTLPLSVNSAAFKDSLLVPVVIAAPPPSLTLAASAPILTVALGESSTASLTSTTGGGFNSAVVMSASGLPPGVTAKFAAANLAAPGAGSSTLTLAVSPSARAGTYMITPTATGGGLTATAPISLTIPAPPSLTLVSSTASVTVSAGSTATATLTSTAGGAFTSTIGMSATGLPAGVTVAFAPASVAAPGGPTMLTITVSSAVTPGTYTITPTASGSGLVAKVPLALNVTPAPVLSLASSSGALTLKAGSTVAATFVSSIGGPFKSAVSLSVKGLPSGVTASWSVANLASPGSGSSKLTLTASSSAKAGTYTITPTASGGGLTATAPITLTVTSR